MRSFLPTYDLICPTTLTDALATLAREPDVWRPFAGGTDLMVLLESGMLSHQRFISLWGLPELRGIEVGKNVVSLGALTTYTDLLEHSVIRTDFPLLCDAAAQTGGVATQNRGTLGGNIGNASPAADTPPALLVYEAELELLSASGARRVPYDRFHTGYKTSVLAPGEIIARIHLPRREGWTATFRKSARAEPRRLRRSVLQAPRRWTAGQSGMCELHLEALRQPWCVPGPPRAVSEEET